MPRYGRLLTDAQWEKIRPLLPQPARHRHGGRPRAADRKVLEGILWILRSRARWQGLPDEFPHRSTCWRRLRNWGEQGPATQDGRALRRYQRRWIVERTIGWLGNFRRLVVRYDRSLTIYRAFFHIACLMLALRRVLQ